jgi:hypothetical protein
VTGTITTSPLDPNENGEGEPLIIRSSSGGLSFEHSNYGVAPSLTYRATQSETISAFFPRFPADRPPPGPLRLRVVGVEPLGLGINDDIAGPVRIRVEDVDPVCGDYELPTE